MRLGIFARTFVRPTLDEVLQAISKAGLQTVQFNLACAGMKSLPETVPEGICSEVRSAFEAHGLKIVAISGTFNAIHPDLKRRAEETSRCSRLIRACRHLGTSAVTLCTGTRDPDNIWRAHPDNATPEAWKDLLTTLEVLTEAAEGAGVDLGIEPETANVIDSARKARALLDEMKSPRLRIVLDGANLLRRETLARQREVLEEAFDLLGSSISMLHAKDFPAADGQTQAAGKGSLDFPFYLDLAHASGFNGPVLLHNLTEEEVPGSVAYVRALLDT